MIGQREIVVKMPQPPPPSPAVLAWFPVGGDGGRRGDRTLPSTGQRRFKAFAVKHHFITNSTKFDTNILL